MITDQKPVPQRGWVTSLKSQLKVAESGFSSVGSRIPCSYLGQQGHELLVMKGRKSTCWLGNTHCYKRLLKFLAIAPAIKVYFFLVYNLKLYESLAEQSWLSPSRDSGTYTPPILWFHQPQCVTSSCHVHLHQVGSRGERAWRSWVRLEVAHITPKHISSARIQCYFTANT